MPKQYLSRKEIEDLTPERKQHFLNRNAVRLSRSLGDIAGLENIGVHMVELEPGSESTEFHFHHDEEEFVYILEGTGTVTLETSSFEVSAGDFIGYPANGLPHTMKNTGKTKLKYLMVGQRLDHDVCDYPNQGKRLYRSRGEWKLVDFKDIVDPRKPSD